MRWVRRAVVLTLAIVPAAGCAVVSGLSDFQKDDCADGCGDASMDVSQPVDGTTGADGARPDSGRSDSGIDAPATDDGGGVDAPVDDVVSVDAGCGNQGQGCCANMACNAPFVCQADQTCGCGSLSFCNGKCIDETGDPANCGSCMKVCPAGQNQMATCTNKVCGTVCDPGFADCADAGTACATNTNGDSQNCGGCGKACTVVGQTCNGGTCGCPGTEIVCGNACTDTTNDQNHCGACGHSCLGGTCLSSVCQPVTLAAGQSGANDIALDATNVYFTTSATISRVPKVGGSVVDLARGQNPHGIALDAANAYFTEPSDVKAIPLGAVNGTPTVLASASSGLYVATDGANVYWTNGGNNQTVQAAPVTPGATRTLASGQSFPYRIMTDGTNVFWGTFQNNDGLWRVPVGGGTATNFVPRQSNAIDLAIDASNVYWIEYTANGTVKQSPLGGGTGTTIASGQNNPFGLTVDATNVYFATLSGIFRVPIGGGSVQKIASDTGANLMANDATAIYWTSVAASGSVVKLAK